MNLPSIANMRTLVRHERGTIIVMLIILLLTNIAVYLLTWHLAFHEQVYSVPEIYNARDLKIQWGGHD